MKRFNLGLVIKLLALAALIVLGVFIYITCSNNMGCGCHLIDKTEPAVNDAPFLVITMTHNYYAKEAVTNEDKSVTMTGWYERMNNKWVYHKGEETIPKIFKPRVQRR